VSGKKIFPSSLIILLHRGIDAAVTAPRKVFGAENLGAQSPFANEKPLFVLRFSATDE
jgi:hypothetical protein